MEIPIEVKFSADDIHEALSKAIMESAIGELLQQTIASQVTQLKSHYNNPLEPVIKKIINQTAYDLIQKDYGETIRAIVKQNLADEVVSRLANKIFNNILEGI